MLCSYDDSMGHVRDGLPNQLEHGGLADLAHLLQGLPVDRELWHDEAMHGHLHVRIMEIVAEAPPHLALCIFVIFEPSGPSALSLTISEHMA